MNNILIHMYHLCADIVRSALFACIRDGWSCFRHCGLFFLGGHVFSAVYCVYITLYLVKNMRCPGNSR